MHKTIVTDKYVWYIPIAIAISSPLTIIIHFLSLYFLIIKTARVARSIPKIYASEQ